MALLKAMKTKIIELFKKLKRQKKTPTIIINVSDNKDTKVSVSIHLK